MGCLRTELHDKCDLDSHNYHGEIYVKKVFWYCDKPSCPICFKRGWAVREAMNVESRLFEASKKFGEAEHVIVSVPKVDYGLKFESLRAKVVKVLAVRKVFGGVLIFHAFRYANREESVQKGVPFGWYWSPHFHCIGFVDGGYGCCRNCSKSTLECLNCDGFEGRTRRAYEKESKGVCGAGYIVKVKGKRKTIFGTAYYQLNHASFRRGGVRAQVATWFGTCSYRRLKLKKADRIVRDVCPLCGHDLERVMYVGERDGNPLDKFWVNECWDKEKDSGGFFRWMLKPDKESFRGE